MRQPGDWYLCPYLSKFLWVVLCPVFSTFGCNLWRWTWMKYCRNMNPENPDHPMRPDLRFQSLNDLVGRCEHGDASATMFIWKLRRNTWHRWKSNCPMQKVSGPVKQIRSGLPGMKIDRVQISFICLHVKKVYNECSPAVIACHSESVVHVVYIVWVCEIFSRSQGPTEASNPWPCVWSSPCSVCECEVKLWNRLVFVNVSWELIKTCCKTLRVFGCFLFSRFSSSTLCLASWSDFHICSYLFTKVIYCFLCRTLGPPNNLDPTRPFMWFPGDCFCWCLSAEKITIKIKICWFFRSRFTTVSRSWPVSHSSWICQSPRPWQDVTRCIFFQLLSFFLSFRFFRNFVAWCLKLGNGWNHAQNFIGFGCPGAVQSSLGLRQLDLCTGRILGNKGWNNWKRHGFMCIICIFMTYLH